ncbi:MAG: HAMP domain-containing sensor histidine kinase, partial [Vicinamibacteria bacterium]
LGVLALLAVSVAMIVRSTQRAQRLAKQQVEFVAGVTHELQTPLAVIRSAGQNLADGVVDGPKQIKEYGLLVEKEGRRLSGMVDQVLQFAGLQSQRSALTIEAVPIDRVIESALADCAAAIEESGVKVDKEVAPQLTVMADAPALRRAIQNLLDNAIKYGGDEKWIGIRAKTSKEGRKREVLITIADKGPGILAEDLPHVFEPFYRGKTAQAGRARGNGLGLALVRQIIEGHGGRITVKSAKGQGTTFSVRLPANSEPRIMKV